MELKKGLNHCSEVQVNATNTALAMGSGDLSVFATPALAAVMENAAMKAVAIALPEGSTTVGSSIDLSHIKPTAMGDSVKAIAILNEIEGRKLTFEIEAMDSHGLVGKAKHIRYIVDSKMFMNKLKK